MKRRNILVMLRSIRAAYAVYCPSGPLLERWSRFDPIKPQEGAPKHYM